MQADDVEIELEGRKLRLTNLEKVLWPRVGFTKRQLISYYAAVAAHLLPHLRDRPLALKRFPDGVDGQWWFQSEFQHRPEWLQTVRVQGTHRSFEYTVVDDVASLVWVANAAAIELHPMLWTRRDPYRADVLVFDLDPEPPAKLADTCRVALALRDVLEKHRMRPFVKISGGRGLHVCVAAPVGMDTKQRAREVAEEAAEATDGVVLDRHDKSGRAGTVLVDHLQNSRVASLIAPYSLRAGSIPTVATPVTWDEVEQASGGAPLSFGPHHVLERLDRHGDLVAGLLPAPGDRPKPS